MISGAEMAIRLLTMATLVGLLFSSGLELTWREMAASLRRVSLARVLILNFLFVPALVVALGRTFHLATDVVVGMALLAAAPFAPVVPTFARLAKGDLALAVVLTGLFPLLSAFFTPVVCEFSLKPFDQVGTLRFHVLPILLLLGSTITLPLV